MSNKTQQFIDFCQSHNVLQFGDFTLKSGRKSKYFFNLGNIYSAEALAQLGSFYASQIMQAEFDFDVLFGAAYKGIPLATVTAVALLQEFDRSVDVAFNRKEVKDHGEGGQLIGAPLNERKVLLIDDVITAGTAIKNVLPLIRGQNAEVSGVIVALDRAEKGGGNTSASEEISVMLDAKVANIIHYSDISPLI